MRSLNSFKGITALFLLYTATTVLVARAQTIKTDSSLFSGTGNAQIWLSGHRGGYDCNLPENSISLFSFTLNNSCRLPVLLEFDIRKSKNGTLFIMHDSTIDRTTNGKGKITEIEDSYLETLFLIDRNGIITSEKIPRFIDVLTHFKHQNVILMLDGKGHVYKEVVSMVKKMDMEDKCIFLTFNVTDTDDMGKSGIKSWISVLAGSESEWKTNFEKVKNSARILAYINRNTPQEVVNDIKKSGTGIMIDVNEVAVNNGKAFSREHYVELSRKYSLAIMITDFPVLVSRFFCN